MINWEKIGSFFLLTSSALILAACGGGNGTDDTPAESNASTTDEQVTLEFYTWGGEGDIPIYQPRIDAFEKENPNIKIDFVQVPSDYDTKLQTMFAGNEAPDIVQVAENGQNFASKSLFIDMGELIESSDIDSDANWADTMKQYTYDGKVFALPDRGGPEILYYNKDLFDEAGLDYPTDDWTIEEYTEAAEKLTVVENGETIQYGASGMDWTPNWGAFIKSNGGSLVEDNEVVINTPENLEVLEWYNDLYQDGFVGTYEFYESVAQSGADSMFSQGRVGMLTTGFWNIGNFTGLDDLNFDIAPMPSFTEPATWPFGSALAISKQSKHPEAAFKFIEYMTGEEAQQILGESLADSPAHIGVLNSDNFTDRQINGKELNMSTIGISAERVKIDGVFEGPYYGELTGEFGNQVKEMLLGRLTPKEAIEKMQVNGENIMTNY